MNAQTRLSLDLEPHPLLEEARRRGEKLFVAGELKIAGAFPVAQDLNHGDELTVTIASPDGTVLTHGVITIAGPPPLLPVESKELGLIGYCRAHKAKVSDAQATPAE